MMMLSEAIIESVQKLLPDADLRIFASPLWGSHNSDHRSLLHQELQKQNCEASHFHSISHTHELGLLVLSRNPVGVDVERSERVQLRTVARMSTDPELQSAPSAAALWCAKEACFKALRAFDQPSVISKISVGDWQNIDSQTETFRLLNPAEFNSPSENRGVVIHSPLHSFAFFIFRS